MNLIPHLTIMIMEDNRADVYLLKQALLKAGINFTALVFEDGESALAYVDSHVESGAHPIPDLAILDLNVPTRDGVEVLARIRQNPKCQDIPVVILSSSPKHVMRDRAAEADCYIAKPTELDEFLQIGQPIRECIESVSARRTSDSK